MSVGVDAAPQYEPADDEERTLSCVSQPQTWVVSLFGAASFERIWLQVVEPGQTGAIIGRKRAVAILDFGQCTGGYSHQERQFRQRQTTLETKRSDLWHSAVAKRARASAGRMPPTSMPATCTP